jgi:hypothetical protein
VPGYGLEKFRVPLDVCLLRLRQQLVSTEIVGLGFETEFVSILTPIRAPASVVLESLLIVLVCGRLTLYGVDAKARLMILEIPPCPGPRAWVFCYVCPKEFLAQDFPGFGSIVLSEVCPVSEASAEEVAADKQVIAVIFTVERPAVSSSCSSYHHDSPF